MFFQKAIEPAPIGFDDVLNTVKEGFAGVVKAVDFGLDIYASVPGRIEALREISADVKRSTSEPVTPAPVDHAAEFFKSHSGAVTIGAIALLVILAVKD